MKLVPDDDGIRSKLDMEAVKQKARKETGAMYKTHLSRSDEEKFFIQANGIVLQERHLSGKAKLKIYYYHPYVSGIFIA